MTDNSRPPLWRQLQAVAQLLLDIRQGRSGTAALQAVAAPLRPGVQALGFDVLRNLGQAQALRQGLAPRQPPAPVDALLCVALALLSQPDAQSYDAFTLVNQAVEAAKRTRGIKPQAAFVNACLRRFLRERVALLAKAECDPVARWNHPQWWIDRVQSDWPEQWQTILLSARSPAPMVLRVNARWGTPAAYVEVLRQVGLDGAVVGAYGVMLGAPCPVGQLPGFQQGWVSVQDAGAQLAAPLLLSGFAPGQRPRVLDACAAPGGKTAHFLEISDAQVLALDVDPARCERIHQNLTRLQLQAKVLAADAADVSAWWDGAPFDAILLDAPCSASGIVRRHPDIAWLRRSGDIDALAVVQTRLLTRLWPLLKPGGRMVYCTCSVFHAEGAQQIQAFLCNNTQARMLPGPGHLLPVDSAPVSASQDNQPCVHDGFYYALLEKTGA